MTVVHVLREGGGSKKPDAITMRSNEAAGYIGTSVWFLQKLAREGKIPCIRVSPRLILFRKESLDEWLREQELASIKRSEAEQAVQGKIRRLV